MLALFIGHIHGFTFPLLSNKFCIADDSSKSLCPSDFTVKSTDSTEFSSLTSLSLYIVSEPTKDITISFATSLSIEGYPSQKLKKITVIPSSSILSIITQGINAITSSVVLKNIDFNYKGNLISAALDLQGAIKLGNFSITTRSFTIGDNVKQLLSDVTVKLFSVSLGETALLTFKEDLNKILSVGVRRIIVNAENITNKLTLISTIPLLTKVKAIQEDGTLVIKKFGNPSLSEILKLDVEADGGIIEFANQKWKQVEGLISSFIDNLNFINIIQKKTTDIIISGRNIPANIKNEGTEALNIIVNASSAGIQGLIQIKNAADKIIGEGFSKFELAVGKFDISIDNFNLDEKIALSLPSDYQSSITGFLAKFDQLVNNLSAKLTNLTQETLSLASDAILDFQMKFDGEELKSGLIDVTKSLQLPEVGKVILNLDADFNSSANFQKIKELITTPRKLFCSQIPFNCSAFKLNVNGGDLPLPEVDLVCEKNETSGSQCVSAKLTKLPEWMPEKYCFSSDASKCPDGTYPVLPQNITQVASLINNLTKIVMLDFSLAEINTEIPIDDYITVGGTLALTGKGVDKELKLKIDKYNNGFELSLSDMKLDLSANSGNKTVKFTVPIIDMKNVDLSDAAKQLLLDFTQSQLVRVDKSSFTNLTNSVFNNLELLAQETISQINLTADKYLFDNFEVLKDKVKGVLSLKDVVIPSSGLTLSASGTSETNGFGFNFNSTGNLGTIKFDNTWNSVTKFDEGFSFSSEGDLTIEGLPSSAPIKVGGSGTLSIKVEEGRPSLTISGNTDINAAGKTIKLTGTIDPLFSINGENLVVGGTGTGSFKVIKEDGTELPISFKNATFEKNASINVLQVIQNLTAKFGSYINISKLIFPSTSSAKRVVQEASSEKDITIGYKFSEDGIPNLRINEVSGTPSNIYLVYNATDRETRDLDASYWIDDPTPIITANFSVEECNNWRKNVVSTFLTQSVKSITLATSCEEGLDDDENFVSLTMSLKEIELKQESNEETSSLTPTPVVYDSNNNNKSGIPKNVLIGIVAGVCIVVVIAVIIGIVIYTKKSKNSKKYEKHSSSSFDESSN